LYVLVGFLLFLHVSGVGQNSFVRRCVALV
jgi:hypothetical protein